MIARADVRPPWNARKLVSGDRGDATDRSYLRQTPTVTGGVTFTSRVLTFDGSTGHVTYADHADLSFGTGAGGTDSPFSAAMWVKPASVAAAYRCAMAKGTAGQYEWSFYAQINRVGNNGPGMFIYNAAASAWISRYVNVNPLSAGTWQHLAWTYSGSKASTGIKVYLNAVQVDDSAWNLASYTGATNGTSGVRVGAFDTGTATHHFNGSIDDIRMIAGEWTAQQIHAIYVEGLGVSRP